MCFRGRGRTSIFVYPVVWSFCSLVRAPAILFYSILNNPCHLTSHRPSCQMSKRRDGLDLHPRSNSLPKKPRNKRNLCPFNVHAKKPTHQSEFLSLSLSHHSCMQVETQKKPSKRHTSKPRLHSSPLESATPEPPRLIGARCHGGSEVSEKPPPPPKRQIILELIDLSTKIRFHS